MTNAEMVEKIVNRTGITAEQAEEALKKYDWDLLEAMIYVEQTYVQKSDSASSFTTNQPAAEPQNPNFSDDGKFNINEEKQPRSEDSSNRNFGKTLKYLINISLSNTISVIHNGNEVLTVPVLVLIILMFSSISTVFMVMFIAMFFDVSYCFKGSELGNDRFNGVLSRIYAFAQNLKSILVK